ncbi:PhzF family phenazine biosynthesis protein [bacterium]|nr:PhzF family phenazine biosynthesis protein [bacterium]
MKLRQYQVDAFASRVFEGNPAAVCPLDSWLSDAVLQSIAQENNLSETAFTVPSKRGYELRWFTPVHEVDLCGHGTLAAAFVFFEILEFPQETICFETRSGDLFVSREDGFLVMDFPATLPEPCNPEHELLEGLGRRPLEVYCTDTYLAVYETEEEIQTLTPNFDILAGLNLSNVIVTAPGNKVDFVSRFFAPKFGIPEDPVTGSAHCMLAPLWATKMGKLSFRAKQISKRGGDLLCEVKGDRVILRGNAVLFSTGEIYL